jgi:hypothetical protein
MASVAFASVGKVIELLNTATAGDRSYVRVLSANRLAIGPDPFYPTHVIDISREVLVPCSQAEPAMNLEASIGPQAPAINGPD